MKTILNSLAIQKHRGGSSLLTLSYMIKKVLLENFLEWNQGSEVVQSSPKDWILFALESGLKSLLEPTCKLCSQSVEEGMKNQVSEAKELSSGGKKAKTHENGSHSTSPIYPCPKRLFIRGLTDRAQCNSVQQKYSLKFFLEIDFFFKSWVFILFKSEFSQILSFFHKTVNFP